jgi:hypothetical protein
MKDKWISVKEGLPTDGENVIVCGYQEEGSTELLTFYNTAILLNGIWFDEKGYFDNGEQVLFWQPLPEPPQQNT